MAEKRKSDKQLCQGREICFLKNINLKFWSRMRSVDKKLALHKKCCQILSVYVIPVCEMFFSWY